MKNRTYIIAGSYAEFHHYMKHKNLNDYQYVDDVMRLYGLRKSKIILLGTYYMRNDFQKLKEMLCAMDCQIQLRSIHD